MTKDKETTATDVGQLANVLSGLLRFIRKKDTIMAVALDAWSDIPHNYIQLGRGASNLDLMRELGEVTFSPMPGGIKSRHEACVKVHGISVVTCLTEDEYQAVR